MKNKLIIMLIHVIFANNPLTLDEMHSKLKINKESIKGFIVPEEKNIVSIGYNMLGKEIYLSKKCAVAWREMQNDALKDSMQMSILSGFRSYYKQYTIINYKLTSGLTLEDIVKENKLPGLSQHHSGNAIDIISNSYKLSLEFEKSLVYAWLMKNAHRYGFYLTYPKDNKDEIMFEPWHWYFKE